LQQLVSRGRADDLRPSDQRARRDAPAAPRPAPVPADRRRALAGRSAQPRNRHQRLRRGEQRRRRACVRTRRDALHTRAGSPRMSTFPADRAPDARPKLAGEYDALADLFLGGSQAASTPVARVAAPDASPSALRLVAPEADAPDKQPGGPRGPEGPGPSSTRPVDAVLLGSLPV